MEQTIELPTLRRAAELSPNTIDPESRSVEVIWSTGARVRRMSLFGEAHDEELSMAPDHVRLERLNNGAPFLKVHDAGDLDAVIGSVVPGSARIENGQGIARIRISERDSVGDIWRDIEAGHIRAVSIGYQVHRYEVSKPEGGRELWRAVDWTPFEISAVPVGADPAAGFRSTETLHDCILHRSAAGQTQQRTNVMHDTDQTEETTREATDVPAEKTTEAKDAEIRQKPKESGARGQPKSAPDPKPQEQTRSVDTDALVTEARAGTRSRLHHSRPCRQTAPRARLRRRPDQAWRFYR